MLKIAISEEIGNIQEIKNHLYRSGIDVDFGNSMQRVLVSKNFPATASFLSKNLILSSLYNSIVDLAILGEHLLIEEQMNYERVYEFSEVKDCLTLFVPNGMRYKDLMSCSNKKIATNAPNIVKSFFKSKKIRGTQIIYDKNPENALEIGFVDYFIDLLSNVNPKNYLTTEPILDSPYVIVLSPKIPIEKRHVFVDELLDRLRSVQNAKHKLKLEIVCDMQQKGRLVAEVRKLDENMIVLSTFDQKKIIIQAIIEDKQLWDIKHYLKEIQAEKIMVYNISQIIV